MRNTPFWKWKNLKKQKDNYEKVGVIFMDLSKASGKINHNLLLAKLRGCSYEGELAQLGGIACLGEMIFIPRSYGMKSSILVQSKSLLCRWKKIDQVIFTINSDVKPSCRTNVFILFI